MPEINIFVERLKTFPKSYFSLTDLKKFYPGKEGNLPVVLNRLVKKKTIIRLMRGFYTLNLSFLDQEALACEILKPSYISFEYALWRHGMMNEVPARITLATTRQPRSYTLPNSVLEYSHLTPKLFFGYRIEKNILLAEKEKAFLDEVYLISLKKRAFNLKRLDLSLLDKNRLKKWSLEYPVFVHRLLNVALK